MKIVLISELFWPFRLGGGEKQFFELAKYLAKKRHEVHIYTVKLPGTPKKRFIKALTSTELGC